MTSPGQSVPAFLALAGHPLRWSLLAALAGSDLRVRELTQLTQQPQNLVSYHLRLLREGGLLTARRSNFDGRDTYYHLDLERCGLALGQVGAELHPQLHPRSARGPAPSAQPRPVAVLFACTGNSARSPIAAALLSHRSGGRITVSSAGSHPKASFHPRAVGLLRQSYGLELTGRPRALDQVTGHRFDHVITVCDRVREACLSLGVQPTAHWSIPDPAGGGLDEAAAFARIVADLDTRITHLLPVLLTGAPPGGEP